MIYNILTKIASVIIRIFYNLEVTGLEHLDTNDKYILCSNHKSALDPIILAISIKEPIYFIAKEELFSHPILGFFLRKLNAIPVNRDSVSKSTLSTAIDVVNNDKLLGIFIEGTRVDEYNPRNAKSGAIMIARLSRANILPVYIDTNYKLFDNIKVKIRPQQIINLNNFEGSNRQKYKQQAEEILKIIYDR